MQLTDVTFGIKTLLRPKLLIRLLDSIYAMYPGVPCIVVDDSQYPTLPPHYKHMKHIQYIKLPYDVGLGVGRNVMIDAVQTKYCLYLDDDYVFYPETRIDWFKAILDAGVADIVGGQAIEDRHIRRFDGLLHKRNNKLVYVRDKRGSGSLTYQGTKLTYDYVDIVLNFFLGDTQVLRRIKWDAELKINTHVKFFWDAMLSSARVAFCPQVIVQHKAARSADYSKLRMRPYYKRGWEKMGVDGEVKEGQWR